MALKLLKIHLLKKILLTFFNLKITPEVVNLTCSRYYRKQVLKKLPLPQDKHRESKVLKMLTL